MSFKKGSVFIAAASLIFIVTLASSQDDPVKAPSSQENQPALDLQWVYAEVISVDITANQLNVKYLDYETETEKEMTVGLDDKTTFENVKSLAEIKPSDTVSIDYVVGPDGKNIARNINVEKSESPDTAPDDTLKTPDEQAQPQAQSAAPSMKPQQ